MLRETSCSYARAHLAALCDEAISTREPIIIHCRGAEDVVLIAADELRGLMETAHLLRSPKNALRLLKALARARSGDLPIETVDTLHQEFELDEQARFHC
jgi:antitoxin YefM